MLKHDRRFILQIPGSSSKVLAWMDAGLTPVEHIIMFIWSTTKVNQNHGMLSAFRYMLGSPEDEWTKAWMNIQRRVGVISELKPNRSYERHSMP